MFGASVVEGWWRDLRGLAEAEPGINSSPGIGGLSLGESPNVNSFGFATQPQGQTNEAERLRMKTKMGEVLSKWVTEVGWLIGS